jgi:hypothetical protein
MHKENCISNYATLHLQYYLQNVVTYTLSLFLTSYRISFNPIFIPWHQNLAFDLSDDDPLIHHIKGNLL